MQEFGELGVAVLFLEPGDGVAASAAAGFALDRERRHEEVGEGVGVVAHGGEPVFGRVITSFHPPRRRARGRRRNRTTATGQASRPLAGQSS